MVLKHHELIHLLSQFGSPIVYDAVFDAIYQDDLTSYLKKIEDHCNLVEKIFKRTLEYRIYLNPKKCQFGLIEGKLLGHIVSKEGVRIDLDRVKVINNKKNHEDSQSNSTIFWLD